MRRAPLQQRFGLTDGVDSNRGQIGRRPIFGHASIVMLLIIHMLLGYRELRHLRYYRHDPLVGRLLGLNRRRIDNLTQFTNHSEGKRHVLEQPALFARRSKRSPGSADSSLSRIGK